MINKIIALLLLPFSALGSIKVSSPNAHINIKTDKVVFLVGPVTAESISVALLELKSTASMQGPTVIYINSPGGSVRAGQVFIDAMEARKAKGAHSMAANILAHCNVRLATAGTSMLFHKILYQLNDAMLNARQLRELADRADKECRPYDEYNAKALGLTMEEYDRAADKEFYWPAHALVQMKFLAGIATVSL